MIDAEPRENIAITIDGGGVKGAMVAYGIIELEKYLGLEEGQPLVSDPRVKVLAGTSTGSILASGLAIGMTGKQLVAMYKALGEVVFGKPGPLRPFGNTVPLLSKLQLPMGVIRFIEKFPVFGEILVYSMYPARYSLEPLRDVLRKELENIVGADTAHYTMSQLGDYLQANTAGKPTLIITAMEVLARKTRFIKSTSVSSFKDFELVEAIVASSCIPTYFPPVPISPKSGETPTRYLVDGGVGNFENPAFVAAWEMCYPQNPDENRRYDPETVTIYSFGTGYQPTEVYRKKFGLPTNWWALDWSQRVIDMFLVDAVREQSRTLISTYQGIDLRRFQLVFDQFVSADDFTLVDTYLKEKGAVLQERIRNNQHALTGIQFDPEGINHEMLQPYLTS